MNDIGDFRHSTRTSSSEIAGHKSQGNTLQIATAKDGHNSGRLYYLQADANEQMEDLKQFIQVFYLADLFLSWEEDFWWNTEFQVNAKAARKRAEARTIFRRWQGRVRKIYESQPFQAIVASFISAVIRVS